MWWAGVEWINLAEDRDKWWTHVNRVMKCGFYDAKGFLEWLRNYLVSVIHQVRRSITFITIHLNIYKQLPYKWCQATGWQSFVFLIDWSSNTLFVQHCVCRPILTVRVFCGIKVNNNNCDSDKLIVYHHNPVRRSKKREELSTILQSNFISPHLFKQTSYERARNN